MEREDEQWQDIVSRLGDDVFTGVPDIIATTPQPVPETSATGLPGDSYAGLVEDDWVDPLEQFIAPAPALPKPPLRTRAAWAAAVAGVALLVTASIAGFADSWSTILGWSLIITGAGVLVARMPTHRDEDDDGAVV